MDDVTRACGDFILRQPDLLASSADLLRVPAREVWLEWWNHKLVDTNPDGSPTAPQRTGLLVHSEEGGRAGTIRSFHENEAGGVDCFPGVMRFDLDAPPASVARPRCAPVYEPLLAQTWLELDPEWLNCYRVGAGRDIASFQAAMSELWTNGFKDALILFSFCLLLSARAGLNFAASNLEKLNRARARRGKAPLLDHVEVSARIFAPTAEERAAMANGRSAARLHHVRGHWVRRDNALFWRRSHLRGSADLGRAPTRTTRLYLGGGSTVRH